MRTVYAYTHVHWDREWYRTFASFRLQLVAVVNDVLNELESGSLSKFYLDGQSIVLDDVLHGKPELSARLESALRSGKLYCGPWYVIADQMLVGGESLIKNLALGISGVSKLGPPALIGYCPDTFGHSQDLPRILNGFGIKCAVVWRGVPRLETGPAFWWRSPDGSSVLAYHLTHGYYHTAFQEFACDVSGIDKLERYVADFADEDDRCAASAQCAQVNGVLLPVGGDHTEPPANFAKIVKDLNKRFQKSGKPLQIVPVALSEFLAGIVQSAAKANNIVQTVDGELRSNRCASIYDRAYLLYGTLSTRLYLKRANSLAEHALVRICQPVCSLAAALGYLDYPQSQLNQLWKMLLRNQPHDSICGCCADEIHRQNVIRYEEVMDFTQNLLASAQMAIAGQPQGNAISCFDPAYGAGKIAVVNTSGSPCRAPVRLKWMRELDDKGALPQGLMQIERRTKIDNLFSFFVGVPYYKEVEELEGWIWPGEVPALGVKVVENPPVADEQAGPPPVAVRSRRLSNGLLEVSVGADGKIVVAHTVPGESPRVYRIQHLLRDVGDGGDTYNFDPIPHDKPIYAKVVDVAAGRQGPLVGSIILTYEMELPASVVEDHSVVKLLGTNPGKIQLLKRSPKRVRQTVKVEMSLRRAVPILFFDSTFDNLASDHRLEAIFETEREVKTSYSENHFSVVQRHHGGRAEKLPVALRHEAAPDRYPNQRFFIANGQVFLNTGLPEYGVEGSAVTITLLRAVSWLSKPQLWTRGGGAGPTLPVPEANCLGPNTASYGWAPLPAQQQPYALVDDDGVASAYQLAETFQGCLWASLTRRDDLAEGSLFGLNNEHVLVVSMHMEEGSIILRLLNVAAQAQNVTLSLKRGRFSAAAEVTLSGANLRELPIKSSSCTLELARHQLFTVRLDLRRRR